jgi:hypothetical protein
MKPLALICALPLMTALTLLPAASEEPKAQHLKCEIGPINKTYGKSQWLAYSCDDSLTLVIVAAPGNPAMPFYFMFSPHEKGYQLSGEGTGQKDATDAAFNDLHGLSANDIAAVIEQTKQK